MERFGDKVQCNPSVKLKKGEMYPSVSIDKITVGYKKVTTDEIVRYTGQGGCKFQDKDILMARITPCLENGKIAVADTGGINGFGSTELFIFRGIDDVSDTNYIYYLLCMPYMRNMAVNSMTGASGRQRADLGFIKKIPWSFPSLDVQQKIANVLSQYDSLIETNNKRIKILEQMAENLYKEWFVRFRFPGHENAEFVDGVPKGWGYCKLKKLLNISYGKDHKNIEDGDIPIFGSGGIMRYGNKALYDGEVVLIPRKGTLNNIMYYSGKLWTVDTMFYAVPQVSKSAKYIYYTLNKFDMESYNSGAALPSMTTAILYNLKILLPDGETLARFDEIIDTMFDEKIILENQNQNLIKQRDYLLPRLMSGKLQVK